MKRYHLILTTLLLLWSCLPAFAQRLDIPHHEEDVNIRFETCNGKALQEVKATEPDASATMLEKLFRYPAGAYTRISRTVSASRKAPWMQVHFGQVQLGENSFVIIRSLHDGDQQYFTAETIAEWQNISGYFNGDAVQIDLYVAPGDQGIGMQVSKIVVGDFYGNDPSVMYRTLCGDDDRVQSTFPHIDARLFGGGCTAWLTAGGFFLTAGHCADGMGTALIEFNVPASLCDGTPQAAAIVDQYRVIAGTISFENAGNGDDWGIFNCGRNSNTLRTPAEAQRSYYHLSRSISDLNLIMIRGFGKDNTPVGCDDDRNADNYTLQFDVSDAVGENVDDANTATWNYKTDTEPANSGSAILTALVPGVDFTAVGIHTHGGCESDGDGSNSGTSLEADDLEAACNTFWQTEVEYADVDHHLSSITGTSVLPHESVQNAVNQANAGHGPGDANLELILIAGSNHGEGGVYREVFHYAGTTHGVILRRTVGAVRIGPNATAAKPQKRTLENGEPGLSKDLLKSRNSDRAAFKVIRDLTAVPNPFSEHTRIRFTTTETAAVKLHVYDLNGTLVRALLELTGYPNGAHEVLFESVGCSPGIYVARLEVGGEVRTIRVGVVR